MVSSVFIELGLRQLSIPRVGIVTFTARSDDDNDDYEDYSSQPNYNYNFCKNYSNHFSNHFSTTTGNYKTNNSKDNINTFQCS